MQTKVIYKDGSTRVINHANPVLCRKNPDFAKNLIDWVCQTGDVKSLMCTEDRRIIVRWGSK